MKTRACSFTRLAKASLLAGLLSCWMTGIQHAQTIGGINLGGSGSSGTSTSTSTIYRGRAVVVSGAVVGVGVSVSDTGYLDGTCGARETSLLSANLQGMVAAEAAHAATIGQNNATFSEASVGEAGVNTCMTVLIGGNVVTADFVMARAMASCCDTGPMLGGSSEIAGLMVNGQAVVVSGQPNQTFDFGNGNRIVINEQIAAQTATTADITVNALHIQLCEGADLVVSSAFAGVTCGSAQTSPPPTPPSECGDFLTGGGWITGTPSGAKANFGVGGGFKNGAFWGHLNYIDHSNGMHVKATAVTGYAVDPNDADCRIIDYNVTIDGQAGTARVRACDKGEPGRNDIFQIQLSNGYFAGGDLGGSRPGGGNIQLHKCQ
ncbi:MAG TPA: choice-of-anchor P family protein [Verrucomicrobiae bacterium]